MIKNRKPSQMRQCPISENNPPLPTEKNTDIRNVVSFDLRRACPKFSVGIKVLTNEFSTRVLGIRWPLLTYFARTFDVRHGAFVEKSTCAGKSLRPLLLRVVAAEYDLLTHRYLLLEAATKLSF